MSDPKSMSDDQFLAAFLDCSMPPAGFDHLGHVRATWLLLQRRPLPEALLILMAHGGGASPALAWPDFLAANGELICDARGLLARRYSDERPHSPQARARTPPSCARLAWRRQR